MAFDVAINIRGDNKSGPAIQEAEAEIKRLSTTTDRLNSGNRLASQTGVQLGKTMQQTKLNSAGLGAAISALSSQLGIFGGVGSVAASSISAMATASLASVAPMAILAAAIAAVAFRVNQARERFRELAEIELKGLQRETKALQFGLDIRKQLQLLTSADPQLTEIRQRYDDLRLAAEKAGTSQDTLAKITKARILEENKLLDERIEAFRKETHARLELEEAKADAADKAAKAEAELFKAEQDRELQTLARTGGALGVPFRGELDSVRASLNELAKSSHPVLKDFQTLDEKLADIHKRLRQTFGVDMPSDLESSQSGLRGLLRTLAGEFGLTLDNVEKTGRAIEQTAAAATRAVQHVESSLGRINFAGGNFTNFRTRQAAFFPLSGEIVFDAFIASSPKVPFSEWLKSYGPKRIAEFARTAGAELTLSIPNFAGSLAELERLQREAQQLQTIAGGQRLVPFSGLGASRVRQGIDARFAFLQPGDAAAALRSVNLQIAQLQNQLASGLLGAEQRGGASGGASGGGVVTNITIDLRDAVLTGEFLDRELLPKLTSIILSTTGKNPGFRTLS